MRVYLRMYMRVYLRIFSVLLSLRNRDNYKARRISLHREYTFRGPAPHRRLRANCISWALRHPALSSREQLSRIARPSNFCRLNLYTPDSRWLINETSGLTNCKWRTYWLCWPKALAAVNIEGTRGKCLALRIITKFSQIFSLDIERVSRRSLHRESIKAICGEKSFLDISSEDQ